MRRTALAAALALSLSLVHHSCATTAQRATCAFDVAGKIEPGLSSLVVPTTEGDITLDGPIRCTGWADGKDLTNRAGSLHLYARNDQGPGGAVGSSCVLAELDFAFRAVFPGRHERPLVMSGTMNYAGEAFDGQLSGTVGGEHLLGRAGIGSDPEGTHGLCTPEKPYADLAMLGQVLLVDDRAGQQLDHQVVLASDEYVNGGTVNAIAATSPVLVSQPVAKGDTITWTNADTHPHTVTACKAPCEEVAPVRTGAFDGDMLQPFTTFTLDTSRLPAGTYDYYCEYHPFMRGSFTVGPGPLRPGPR